jgi:hypothetical protein
MAVFWDAVTCRLVEIDRRFRGTYYLHHHGYDRPEDGRSKHLWNVGQFLPDMAQHPRRQPYSYVKVI